MQENIERISRPLELAASFMSAMSRVASSVALVTTIDENGQPHGLAATTFLSVSMNPASALICVNRSASASPVIKDSGVFCVVPLQSIHEEISARFIRPDNRDKRFVHSRWRTGPAGLPFIDDASAVFCSVAREVEHGTHTVIIGNVHSVIVPEVQDSLVYMGGRYVRLDAGDVEN
ncbi:flavin reductase family protein [Paraburkholderia dipogonis]|uniref:flavin reductase family protein n=1 Tax=Paraburkholderia dipogonis TaxID=1211383 RepID=UPI0038BC4E92